jgi:hypothetical protein
MKDKSFEIGGIYKIFNIPENLAFVQYVDGESAYLDRFTFLVINKCLGAMDKGRYWDYEVLCLTNNKKAYVGKYILNNPRWFVIKLA